MDSKMDSQNKKPPGIPARPFPFSSRAALAIGLICLSPLLVGHALSYYEHGNDNDHFVAMVLFLLLTTTLMTILLLRDEPVEAGSFMLMGLILLLAVYLRAACLDRVTNDYDAFLSAWMNELREGGGFAALGKMTSSDYNVPYLYLLALLSYLPLDDLLLIKFVSIVADFILAWTAMALVKQWGLPERKSLFALGAVLFVPTVWLNSAYWAQCDVLYAVFALLCLLYVLRGRPWIAVAMAGIAFAFKLQAVFFLPMLIVFLMTRRLKVRHMLAFPAAYLLACSPALLLGRPVATLFTIYFDQTTRYSSYLNLNSPSAFALLDMNRAGEFSGAPFFTAGIVAAALTLILALYWLSHRIKYISNTILLTIALFFCIAIPWCLPSMHERYFYMADVFAVLYAIVHPKRFYIAPMVVYASYAGYHAYLFWQNLPFSMWAPALLLAVVAGFLIQDLRAQCKEGGGLPAMAMAPARPAARSTARSTARPTTTATTTKSATTTTTATKPTTTAPPPPMPPPTPATPPTPAPATTPPPPPGRPARAGRQKRPEKPEKPEGEEELKIIEEMLKDL
ncbi:MAG: glycosyltransferase 87 family protein [Oscillospiraceae bacterium]|nr:glycosyltransferase 87 family protein [Oscillospiraceae bacterium]